jgi:tripartite-type tricarboxylate transporter receptor subunit TctC
LLAGASPIDALKVDIAGVENERRLRRLVYDLVFPNLELIWYNRQCHIFLQSRSLRLREEDQQVYRTLYRPIRNTTEGRTDFEIWPSLVTTRGGEMLPDYQPGPTGEDLAGQAAKLLLRTKMTLNRRGWLAGSAGLVLTGLARPGLGQAAWPTKPITYVVPFPAGGNTDTLARLIGQKLSPVLGQPVIIDNKPGAGGNIGSAFVAQAKPDGHTILGGTISSHAINPSIYPSMPYDVVKSFEPILLIGTSPLVLVVGVNTPYRSLANVIAAARSKPGDLTFASAGNGTSPHLAGELLNSLAGIKLTHVPYKGSAPAISDVMAGHVPMMFDTALIVGPHLKAGKVRALAIASSGRINRLPDVPTTAEAGVPGLEIGSWQAIFAPAGVAKEIVRRLNTEIAQIMKLPDVAARLADLGVEPAAGPPEELAELQRNEISKWAKVVKEAGIKPD